MGAPLLAAWLAGSSGSSDDGDDDAEEVVEEAEEEAEADPADEGTPLVMIRVRIESVDTHRTWLCWVELEQTRCGQYTHHAAPMLPFPRVNSHARGNVWKGCCTLCCL